MKTYMQRKEDVTRTWYVVDAEGQTLGRLASKVANVLRGKHKPTYTPHIDGGDYVIVVNANKMIRCIIITVDILVDYVREQLKK